MTTTTSEIPPLAKALQDAGYKNDDTSPKDRVLPYEEIDLKVQLLSDDATAPTRSTKGSAGLDLYSTVDEMIEPGMHSIIPLDIAIEAAQNTYAQIATRSSFAVKGIMVLGGVIDSDYRGNIKVIIKNNSTLQCQITKSQRIAQMIIHQIQTPAIKIVDNLTQTLRGKDGFGSSERKELTTTPTSFTAMPHIDDTTFPVNHATAAVANVQSTFEFTSNPYDNIISITMENKGTHPTRGLDVSMNKDYEKLQLF